MSHQRVGNAWLGIARCADNVAEGARHCASGGSLPVVTLEDICEGLEQNLADAFAELKSALAELGQPKAEPTP